MIEIFKQLWAHEAVKKKYIDHSELRGILDKDIMNAISHINSEKDKHGS